MLATELIQKRLQAVLDANRLPGPRCTHCQGTGKDEPENKYGCETCGASGTDPRSLEKGTPKPCKTCKGRGMLEPKACRKCGGHGRPLEEEVPTDEASTLRRTIDSEIHETIAQTTARAREAIEQANHPDELDDMVRELDGLEHVHFDGKEHASLEPLRAAAAQRRAALELIVSGEAAAAVEGLFEEHQISDQAWFDTQEGQDALAALVNRGIPARFIAQAVLDHLERIQQPELIPTLDELEQPAPPAAAEGEDPLVTEQRRQYAAYLLDNQAPEPLVPSIAEVTAAGRDIAQAEIIVRDQKLLLEEYHRQKAQREANEIAKKQSPGSL